MKGVVGRSLLLSIPNFDLVDAVPTEYLHLVCLGVVKRLIELTFAVGDSRSRITKRKLSHPRQFNNIMKHVKCPREFSRRARSLDFSVLKAQEFRNILIFFFPAILSCIPHPHGERKLWLLLTFLVRALILPEEEYDNYLEEACSDIGSQFYVLYEDLFGTQNCTYSIHVMSCHLLRLRKRGPLTDTSAFKFESFYGELRNSFIPGTRSPLKQILQTVYLRRALSNHLCQSPIHYSPNDTCLETNSLIYTFNETHRIYIIHSILGDTLQCSKVGQYPVEFEECPQLKFSCIGVFQRGPLSHCTYEINRSEVKGKVLEVLHYLITCPLSILREK